jgi:hypothetical protein
MARNFLELFWYFLILCTPCLIPAAIFYARHRGPNEQRFPLWLYVVTLLICSYVAYCVATGLGVEYACRKPAGNLCGLAGVFVAGPLGGFVTVTVLAWLMTSFPLQMKRIVPVALVLSVAGGAYHFRYEFFGHWLIKDLDGLGMYRLQSADVDALQRYAPMMEAKLRDLSMLKDVCLDSELTSDQAIIARDPAPKIGVLPTRSIKFRVVPPSTLNDAIAVIGAKRVELGIPKTFESNFSLVQSHCH